MPDEQHGTLTLNDLLGLSGGPSGRASEGGFGMLEDSSELLRELVGVEEAAPLSLDNLPSLPKIPAGLAPVEPEKTKSEPQPEPTPAKEAAPEVGENLRSKQQPTRKTKPEQGSKLTQQPRQKQKQKARPKLESKLTQEARPKQELLLAQESKLKQEERPKREAKPARDTRLQRESNPKQESKPEQEFNPKQESKSAQESKPEAVLERKQELKPRLKPESQQEVEPVSVPERVCETSLASYGSRLMRKGKHAREEAKERAFSGKHAASVAKDAPEQGRTGTATEPELTVASKPAPAKEPATTHGTVAQSAPVSEPAPQPAPTPAPKSAPQHTSAPKVVSPVVAEPALAQNRLVPDPKSTETPVSVSAPCESSTSRLERLNELSRRLESQILASSATFQQSHEKIETPTNAPADTLSSHEQSLPDWCVELSPKESSLFDEPPQTIAEGMEDGQREHFRIIRIKIALGAMAALLLVACAVGVAQQLVAQFDEQNPQVVESLDKSPTSELPSGDQQSSAPTQPEPGTNPSDPSTTPNQPQSPQQDRSGTVVYRYVTNNATGTDCTITETVTFNQAGLCETSEMEVKLADEAAAQEFAQVMQRDYGPDAEVSVDGTTVRAQLSIASNALDREAYEDALRASVRDLTIVKKS